MSSPRVIKGPVESDRLRVPGDRITLGGNIPRHVLNQNFAFWCANSGVLVDGYRFSYDGHTYLYPLFSDDNRTIVLMKAAQMGATVYMLLKAFHMAMYPRAWGYKIPIKIGFYFPTGGGLTLMVRTRVNPMIESCPDLAPFHNQRLGWKPYPPSRSSIYYFGMASTVNKDSTPLMVEFFDEVRLMSSKDIDQAEERVSHSPIKFKHFVSTAGLPHSDIHQRFLNSDQKWFTTICDRCNYEQVLPLEFPDCIAEHTIGPRAGQVYYICKKCRERLRNTQRGRYIPHGDPNHPISGYQFSQLISTRITAWEIWDKFKTTTNKSEFWNAKLGMPYVDAENKPLSIEMLDSFVNPLITWGQESGGYNVMGVDQMMGLNYVFVLNRKGDRRRLVWFEIVEDSNPFERTAELFQEFNCQTCVCDAEPNTNEALRFARDFKGKVFLCKYGSYNDAATWHDKWKPSSGQRRARVETYYQYRLFLDKYKAINYTVDLVRQGAFEWPDPDTLIQEVVPLDGGSRTAQPILRTHAYPHWASPVRERKEIDEASNTYKWRWVFAGIDPHALDALVYATYAAERRMFVASLYN